MSDNRGRRVTKAPKPARKRKVLSSVSSDSSDPSDQSDSDLNDMPTTPDGKHYIRDDGNKQSTSKRSLMNGPAIKKKQSYTRSDIESQLKNYEKLDSVSVKELANGDRVRYFEVMGNSNFKYKPGGYVLINGAPEYLVLTNGKKNWSVQLATHVIFKALDYDKMEEAHNKALADKDALIDKLRKMILKKDNSIKRLTQQVAILKNED